MKVETNSKVLEMTQLSSGAWSMTLETHGMAGQVSMPGQFVHVKCGHSRLLRRPISICNWSAQRDLVRLVFEVRGEGTEWLARRQVGDSLDVLGPLGRGFDVSGKKLLVVGGGIGVPPMLGCAKEAARRGSEVHAVLGGPRGERMHGDTGVPLRGQRDAAGGVQPRLLRRSATGH